MNSSSGCWFEFKFDGVNYWGILVGLELFTFLFLARDFIG